VPSRVADRAVCRGRDRRLIPTLRGGDSWISELRCGSFLADGLIREAGDERSDFCSRRFRGGRVAGVGRVKDANQARRLLAIAAVYDGMDREEAARIGGMDRQTLRDWVHRFNEQGPAGLINIKPPGRPSRLSAEQKEALCELVEAGPDPLEHGVVRWRCVDLKRVLGERFGVDLSEVRLGQVLKELGFSHISARPRHPAQKAQAIAAFKKTSPPSWLRH